MNYRTDLVLERKEIENLNITGTKSFEKQFGNATLTALEVQTDEAAKTLSVSKGRYYTVEFPHLESICDDSGIAEASLFALKELTGDNFEDVMIVGLGNSDITPDALGPKVAHKILATRHLGKELRENIGLENLKNVSVLVPGVLGKTGIEAFDIVNSAKSVADAKMILVIDALAAISPKRLCRTFQFTDTGIRPGSGVQNARKRFAYADFHVPVIAVGMPTVIDAHAYSKKADTENMMVTPKDIDMLIDKASSLLSDIINTFLQPSLDRETIKSLT